MHENSWWKRLGSQVLQGLVLTAKEAKGYFQNLDNHLVEFIWENNDTNVKLLN